MVEEAVHPAGVALANVKGLLRAFIEDLPTSTDGCGRRTPEAWDPRDVLV